MWQECIDLYLISEKILWNLPFSVKFQLDIKISTSYETVPLITYLLKSRQKNSNFLWFIESEFSQYQASNIRLS